MSILNFFFLFSREASLDIHVISLLGRQFTWYVKSYFLKKKEKNQNFKMAATNFAWHFNSYTLFSEKKKKREKKEKNIS